MKIKELSLYVSAGRADQFPPEDMPEIAFAGRSNVGKSSLINLLLGRRNFARTSSTPGKTRTINFYEINRSFRFADLPGYGYAKVSKEMKESWAPLMEAYLLSRPNLIATLLLIDVRRSPQDIDIEMARLIKQTRRHPIVVLTKTDKLNQSQLHKSMRAYREVAQLQDVPFIPTSTLRQRGKYPLWDAINDIFRQEGLDIFVERQRD
ncbi:MAG: YihA family ribosome biogenesis GTP-binding protein [Tissierellia bacterium]|nr:ribosome biogenesis GTP-binding protein YihA/YsxC [Bacillota bacterium]NLL22927.1 YihA family ribosome biogenesis GTP-binding protein [Tissierellia bacterium]